MKILGNLEKGLVFVLSAPAGTGKTTLVRLLSDEFPMVIESVSCTTRPPRAGEIPDRDYHFLSKEEFKRKIEKDDFLEYAEVFGHLYGTLKSEVVHQQKLGKHVILVIDTQGALVLKEKRFSAIFIFVKPPSLIELRERLFKRKTEGDQHIEERLNWATREMQMAEQYDYQIVNDSLNHAYDVFRSIVIAEEHKTKNKK